MSSEVESVSSFAKDIMARICGIPRARDCFVTRCQSTALVRHPASLQHGFIYIGFTFAVCGWMDGLLVGRYVHTVNVVCTLDRLSPFLVWRRAAERQQELRMFAVEHQMEWVESACDDDEAMAGEDDFIRETFGVERVREALHNHLWPVMQRKVLDAAGTGAPQVTGTAAVLLRGRLPF